MTPVAPAHQLADPEDQVREPRRIALLRSLRDDGPASTQRALARRSGQLETLVSKDLYPLRVLGLVDARRLPGAKGTGTPVRITEAGLAKLAEIEREEAIQSLENAVCPEDDDDRLDPGQFPKD